MKHCENCSGELEYGECWFDYDLESYRHAEFYVCKDCSSIFTVAGDLVYHKADDQTPKPQLTSVVEDTMSDKTETYIWGEWKGQ